MSAAQPDSRRWLALGFIAVAQLMIALDATIVSIALPSAQADLRFSDADRQWVITAYTLAFGGLLLLGGRVSDYIGRKRAFIVGLVGFAAASAVGGAAPSFGVLIAARATQGAFAALLAPTALSLVAVSFTQARERATAFAVYGSIAGSGAAIGFLLGGALTQYLVWRWCLYVNIPIAAAAGVGGWLVLRTSAAAARPRIDVVGAILAVGAFTALIYACSGVATAGWSSPTVVGLLVASAVLVLLFVVRESRTANPLLPLRILADRNRAGAYLMVALTIAGMFGAYLFLTYYLQVVQRYTPLEAGLAFLPITVASQAASWLVARRLIPRVPPRALIVPGVLIAAAGIALLTQLQVGTSFLTVVLPAEVLLGAGISTAMVPAFSTATQRVDPREAGIASATVNAAQQIGASLGTALLNAIAITVTAGYVGSRAAALVHGFSVATGWGAAILVLAALTAALLVNAARPAPQPAH
jgi:EmrB/QacA subfamily drug resistance transporter